MNHRLRGVISGTLLGVMMVPSFAAYTVKKGDSLSLISRNHYGTFEKWRDLWAINREKISNPDLIYPGSRLRLLDEKTAKRFDDSIKVAANGNVPVHIPKKRSQEWRLLPLQPWEQFTFQPDPSIDPDGFDRRSKVAVRKSDSASAEMTIESDRLAISGEVVASRSEFARLFVGEQIMIHADEPLQVGSIYAITPGPEKLVSQRDGRVGFSYEINGRVRIIGVRDGLFIGTLLSLSNPVLRNQLLIPDVPDLIFPIPVAADQPMAATVIVPPEQQHNFLAQQEIVFLDVGLEDGIKPGMIFRQFVHTDPFTKQEISSKDFIIESELQVLRAMDKFSIAVILNSLSSLKYGDEVIALTDLADFKNHNGLQTVIQERGQIQAIDDLDKMDINDGLGEKENKDLRQLEKWNKPSPEAAPAPLMDTDEIQKISPRSARGNKELGQELAPNDGSDKSLPAPDTSSPETAPPSDTELAPTPSDIPMTPETSPVPGNDAPPLMGDESSPEVSATPADIPADVPAPPGDANTPANGIPSGDDPFATPAPPEP